MNKAKLKFTQDGIVDGELLYKAGETYEIGPMSSVERWLRRGAILIESKPEKVEIVGEKKQDKPKDKKSKQVLSHEDDL